MTVSGMRPDEVRAMAGQVRGQAGRLRAIVTHIDGRVARSSWVGPQANRFRSSAWPRHRSQLLTAAQGLEQLAADAERQAAEQERTSGSAGASLSSPTGPPSSGPDWVRVAALAGAAFGVAGTVVNTMALPGLFASSERYNPVTWNGYLNRLVRGVRQHPLAHLPGMGSVAERGAGLLASARPVASSLSSHPFTDLRNSPAVTFLRSEGARGYVQFLDRAPVKAAGNLFGAASVVQEGYGAYEAAKKGDWTGAALGGADTVAAGLKMSKNPLAFGVGVVIDGATDAVEYGTGRKKGTWNPLSLL